MTLVELLIVVAIIALFGSLAVPTFRQSGAERLDLVETQVANAIDYARYLAEGTGTTHGVVFDPASDGFAIVDGAGAPVTDPLTRGVYIVTFDRPGQVSDIDCTAADFGSNGTAAIFGPGGLPDRGGSVTFACKGETRVITVLLATGEVVGS